MSKCSIKCRFVPYFFITKMEEFSKIVEFSIESGSERHISGDSLQHFAFFSRMFWSLHIISFVSMSMTVLICARVCLKTDNGIPGRQSFSWFP